jgi:methylglutaconyl-CoA hydratase
MAIDATRWHSAEWARQTGLFAETHADVHGLDEAVQRLAGWLAQASPDAMAELKQVLWEGTGHWDSLLPERAAISGRLVLAPHARRAIDALRKG